MMTELKNLECNQIKIKRQTAMNNLKAMQKTCTDN